MPEKFDGIERRKDASIDPVILKQLMNLQEQSLNAFSVVSQKLTEILAIENRVADKINDMISKSNISDRDHSDVKQQLNQVTQNTFDIINTMNRASNEKIINLIENIEDCNTAFSYKLTNIEAQTKSIGDKFNFLVSIDNNIKSVSKFLLEGKKDLLTELFKTTKSFDLIKKILGIISILIAGAIISSSIWKSIQDHNFNKEVKYMIQEEIRKIQ